MMRITSFLLFLRTNDYLPFPDRQCRQDAHGCHNGDEHHRNALWSTRGRGEYGHEIVASRYQFPDSRANLTGDYHCEGERVNGMGNTD